MIKATVSHPNSQVPTRDQMAETAAAIVAAANRVSVTIGTPFGPIPPQSTIGAETVALGIFWALPPSVRIGRVRYRLAHDMVRVAYINRLLSAVKTATQPKPEPTTELSWEQLTARVPRLKSIIAEARRDRARRRPNDNEWITYSRLKRALSECVGWDAQGCARELRTQGAYEIAHDQLVRALGV